MSEERRDGWLMRLLDKPLFGTTPPGKPRPKFDELSHSEQQVALLRGEWNLRFIPIMILMHGSAVMMIIGDLLGSAISRFATWPLMSVADPDAEHPSEFLLDVLPGWTALLVGLYSITRWGGPVSRFAIARWPNWLAALYADDKQRRSYELTMRWMNGVFLSFIPLLVLFNLPGSSISMASQSITLLLAIAVAAYGCLLAGRDPCCRQCAYSLPLEDPLPERCYECGATMTEPWGRRLGRSRKSLTWRAVLLALWLLPVVLGALFLA